MEDFVFEDSMPPDPLATGFPSPAEDYVETSLDLNTRLVRHPAATFFVRVRGNGMRSSGIYDGDLLIIDRALKPTPGRIVVAVEHGQLTLRLLARDHLAAARGPKLDVWGVVTYYIHQAP